MALAGQVNPTGTDQPRFPDWRYAYRVKDGKMVEFLLPASMFRAMLCICGTRAHCCTYCPNCGARLDLQPPDWFWSWPVPEPEPTPAGEALQGPDADAAEVIDVEVTAVEVVVAPVAQAQPEEPWDAQR